MTDPASQTSLEPNAKRAWLAPCAIVFVGVTILLGCTIRTFGITTDEPVHIRNHAHAVRWLEGFSKHSIAENLSKERLADGWRSGIEVNKNLPLPTFVSLFGYAVAGQFDSFPASFRWGNVFVFALACSVIFHWVRVRYSTAAAAVALAAVLGNPRLFAHANLLAVDTLVGCFWIFASWALVNSRTNWRWAIAFGVLAGIGSTVKPTFWFAGPMWVVWGLFNRPKELFKPFIGLFIIAPITVVVFSPMWWTSPIGSFIDYMKMLGTDDTGWAIGTYYLGDIYQTATTESVPWHAVPVMTAIATPLWILALALIGGFQAIRNRSSTADDGMLWLMSAVTLPLVCMLPNTPNHESLRLFRSAFMFAPLLAAAGFESIRTLGRKAAITEAQRSTWAWIPVAAIVALAGWQTVRMHPGQLSFYNLSIGGLPGAAENQKMPLGLPERNRPRFEIAYWWAAMNEDAFTEMQTHIPEGESLTIFPAHYGMELLREHGKFRDDIKLVYPADQPNFILLYGRLGSLADPVAAPFASIFLHREPVWEKRIDGVRVAALFQSQ